MMYESPIEVIYGQIQMDFEDNVMKAVQNYNINVNKDALISALMYDRHQYEKGFAEGREDGKKEIFNKLIHILRDNSFPYEIHDEEFFMGKKTMNFVNVEVFKELFNDVCPECPYFGTSDLREECKNCQKRESK